MSIHADVAAALTEGSTTRTPIAPITQQHPGLTAADVASAVEQVVGSFEIIDSRIADWRIGLVDTIADNASSAGVVVGGTRLTLDDVDVGVGVVEAACELRVNGEAVGSGTGAAALGSPLEAVAWLANTLGELGVELAARKLVLPGSVCAAVAVRAGDVVEADFGPLGVVAVTFG